MGRLDIKKSDYPQCKVDFTLPFCNTTGMNKKHLNNNLGFSSLVLVIVIAVVAVGGYAVFQALSPETVEKVMMEKKDEVMVESPSPTPEAMMKDEKPGDDVMMELKFSGQVLAGTSSPLLDFNKADYDKAVASGKLVALYFYANWCPLCKAEFPKMEEAFNKISDDKVVGFRVNFKDNQTDGDEEGLAKEFGVAYQHTKVFVKNGQRVLKAPESWSSADTYISKINEYK